jgi:hypothetical protein
MLMPRKKSNRETERVEFTAGREWVKQLESAAKRLGLSTAAFIRLGMTRFMDDPAFAPPAKPATKRKGGQ